MAAAGAITFSHQTHRSIRRLVMAWTSSAGGAVQEILSPVITGELLGEPSLSRRSLFGFARQLIDAAHGAGFLTPGEYDEIMALVKELGSDAQTVAPQPRPVTLPPSSDGHRH